MKNEIIMLFCGMGISLLTTFILWLAKTISQKVVGLKIELRVLDRTNGIAKIKFRFINRSKETKYVQNIKIYYDGSKYQLIQCENQVEIKNSFCITRESTEDTSFSVCVPPESIKETILCFDGQGEIDINQDYNLWFNYSKHLYSFNMESNNWQKISKKQIYFQK